jgi:hypothetical protein
MSTRKVWLARIFAILAIGFTGAVAFSVPAAAGDRYDSTVVCTKPDGSRGLCRVGVESTP